MLYVVLRYSIWNLPCNVLATTLSSGIGPRVDPFVDILDPDAARPDEQRHTAALMQQTADKRLAEKFL